MFLNEKFFTFVMMILVFMAIIIGLPMYLFGCDDAAGGYCDRYDLVNGIVTGTGKYIHVDVYQNNTDEKNCVLYTGLSHLSYNVQRDYNRNHYPVNKNVSVYFDKEVGNCKTIKYANRLGIAGLFFIILPFAFPSLILLYMGIRILVKKWNKWANDTRDQYILNERNKRITNQQMSNVGISDPNDAVELTNEQITTNEKPHYVCNICKQNTKENNYTNLKCGHYLHKSCCDNWNSETDISCLNCASELRMMSKV